jgi:hypothetical protein
LTINEDRMTEVSEKLDKILQKPYKMSNNENSNSLLGEPRIVPDISQNTKENQSFAKEEVEFKAN